MMTKAEIYLSFSLIVITCSNPLVSCSNVDGDVKLDKSSGIVLVYNSHDNDYLNICWDRRTSDSISNTICKQMGLAKAEWSKKMKPKRSKVNKHKIAVESCSDDGSHIYRCKYSLKESCYNKMVLTVKCVQTAYVYEGQLRLQPMNHTMHAVRSSSEGRLQIYLNKRWTFVCNETFGENEATTACRQLGYTSSISYAGEISDPIRYNENNVWIGFDTQNGKLDCDEPEDCLTKCYSKPTQEKNCQSGALVYLQCDFIIQNLHSGHSSAGSPFTCAITEELSSVSKRNTAVGIIIGSIFLLFICVFGILIVLYCSASAKKPSNYSSHDQSNQYQHLNSLKESGFEEELETSFNDNKEYRPPVITQIVQNNDKND